MRRTFAIVVIGLVALMACSVSDPRPSRADSGSLDAPCGRDAGPPRTYDSVVWIVLENHSFEDLIGSPGSLQRQQSPFLNRLADDCGLATNFWAVTHPSLPNYLALASGRTGGVDTSCTPAQCPQRRTTVFELLRSGGGSWRVFAESMPSACRRTDAYPYVVRHNPPTYFPGLAGCRRFDRPMGSLRGGRFVDAVDRGRLPDLTLVVPNQCHNTHNCPVTAGDRWLSRLVPRILDGPDYREGRTALFVTWDEGAGGVKGQSCRRDPDRSCHIVTVVVSPTTVPGTRSAVRFDLYSLLETTQRMLGVRPLLGHAGDDSTRSMRRAFDL